MNSSSFNSSLHECQIKLENSRAELSEVENKLKAAREEKQRKESAFGAMKLAIEQLLQRTLVSCRLPQRMKAMIEFVEAPKGQEDRYRTDLLLMAISERITELMWLKEKSQQAPNFYQPGIEEYPVVCSGDWECSQPFLKPHV